MKTIIFHIGTNKTGTTTLQNSLAKSRKALQAGGFLYPALSDYTHHTHLLFALLNDSEYPGAFGRSTAQGLEASRETSRQLWATLEEQVTRSDCHTMILSTEYAFGMLPESWERVSARLATFGADLHLVGYFRSPSSHYNSGQQQILKFGHIISSPLDRVPYKGKIQKLRGRAGAKSIRVSLFDRASLKGGDIITDFTWQVRDICGVDLPTIDRTDDNESVSAEAIRLCHAFNKRVFGNSRRPGNPTSMILLNALRTAESRMDGLTRPQLRPEVKVAIDAVHKAEAVWLRDQVGIVFPDFDFDADPAAADALRAAFGDRPLVPDDIFIAVDQERLTRFHAEVLATLFDTILDMRGQPEKRIPQPREDGVTPTIRHLVEIYFPQRPKAGVTWENYRRLFQKTLIGNESLPTMPEGMSQEQLTDALVFVLAEMTKKIQGSVPGGGV